MKFEIFQGKNKKFYFNLKAKNGQVVLKSQGYTDRRGAKNGIKSCQTNSGKDGQFDRKVAKNGKPHFSLTARNGEIIGSSQMYASKATMEKGIASVKRVAPEAVVVDTTK